MEQDEGYNFLLNWCDLWRKFNRQNLPTKWISGAALPNDGAFTTIRQLSFKNMPWRWSAKLRNSPVSKPLKLCRLFGKYLYGRFTLLYPHIMESYKTAEALLTHVGQPYSYRSLYPLSGCAPSSGHRRSSRWSNDHSAIFASANGPPSPMAWSRAAWNIMMTSVRWHGNVLLTGSQPYSR